MSPPPRAVVGVPRPLATDQTPQELTHICRKCRKVIDDGRGYICIDRAAAFERPAQMRNWRKELHKNCKTKPCLHQATDLAGCPPIVHWQTYHTRCDQDRDISDRYYRIDVERCRTVWALLEWTAHLIAKKWFIHTDWHQFLYAMHAQAPAHEPRKTPKSNLNGPWET